MSEQNIDAIKLNVASNVDTKGLDKLIYSLTQLKYGTANVKELTSELTKLKASLKGVGTSGSSTSKAVNQSGEAAEKSTQSYKKFANQLGATAIKMTALIVVFRKLATVISNGILESMNYTETLNLFTVSMGEYADNAKKYAEYAGEALGIDPAEFMRNQAMFNTVIKGFGVGAEEAAYMSQNVTQLAYDMASLDNITIEEAMQKLNSAIAGELEPVRRVGYDLSQNRLTQMAQDPSNYGNMTFYINEQTGAIEANTEAYENNSNAIIANYNDMTQAEKVQLRYIALMKQVPWTQQDLARSLNDPANQLRIFKAQLTQTSRALGNVFIPVLNQVLPYLQAGAMILKEWLNYLAALAGFELPDMSDRAWIDSNVTDAYDDIADDMGRAAGNAKKLKDYMIGIDELNVLRPDDGSGSGSGLGKTYSSGLNFNLPGYDFFGEGIQNQAKMIKEAFEEAFRNGDLGKLVKEKLGEIGNIMILGAGQLGSRFWAAVFHASPEEFGKAIVENGDYGKPWWQTAGKMFAMGTSTAVQNYVFGGLTPAEFAEKMFAMGDADKSPLEMFGKFFTIGSGEIVQDLFFGGMTPEQLMEGLSKVAYGNNSAINNGAFSSSKTWFNSFASKIRDQGYKLSGAINAVVESEHSNIALCGENTGNAYAEGILSTRSVFESAMGVIRDSISAPLTGYMSHFTDIGSEIGHSISNGIVSRRSDVHYSGLDIRNTAIRAFSNDGHYGEFNNIGHHTVSAFREGINEERHKVYENSHTVYDFAVRGMSNDGHYGEFTNIGHWIGYSVDQGIYDKSGEAYNAGKNLYNTAASGASNNGNYATFHSIGQHISAGMAQGINSNEATNNLKSSVQHASNVVKDTLKNIFQIHSPSLWAKEQGAYVIEGFNIGVTEEEGETLKVMDSWARTVTDSMSGISLNPGNFTLPALNQEVSASVQATADSSFGTIAVGIYEAVANALSSEDRTPEFKIMLDGRELYSSMQAEGRARGYNMSNNGFGG